MAHERNGDAKGGEYSHDDAASSSGNDGIREETQDGAPRDEPTRGDVEMLRNEIDRSLMMLQMMMV